MKTTKKLIAASIVAVFLPGIANALPGYLTDTSGKVVKNSYGECWHAGFWTPAMAIAECDPDYIKQVESPAPKVVAATPEPVLTSAPAPQPQKVAPQTVSLSADTLFAFDKAVLKPEGKLQLDGLVKDLNSVDYDSIHVTGSYGSIWQR